MINVTDTIKEAYEKSTTQYDKIVLDNEEYVINNVELDDDCYDEGNIFGTAIAKTLSFEIDSTINLEGKEFKYYTGIKTVVGTEWSYLGTFIIQDVELNDTKKLNKVNAMDYMLKSNIEYISELDYSTNTVTILQVLQEACNQAGLTLATFDFPNSDFIVDSNQFETGTLVRQVISAVAQTSGSVAKIKNDDKLYLITPKTDGTVRKVFKLSDYSEIEIKRATHPINLVSLGMSDIEGENVVMRDEESISQNGENSLIINDNPFAYTESKRQQLITAIFNAVKGFEYKSYSMIGQCIPYLETLDNIQLEDFEGNIYNSFLFRFYYKSPNGLESEMSAPSITDAAVKYQNVASAEQIAKRAEYIVNKHEQTITQIVAKTEENTEQITEIKTTTEGTTTKITDIEQELNNTTGELETVNASINEIKETVSGMEQTLTQQGGSNLLLNSSGLFENENWEGVAKTVTNTEIQNNFIAKACFNLQKSENLIDLLNQNFSYTSTGVAAESMTQDSVKFVCDAGTQAWTGAYSEKLNLQNGVTYKFACKVSENSDMVAPGTGRDYGIVNIRARNKSTNVEDRPVQLNFDEKDIIKSGEFTADTETYDYYILFQPVIQNLIEAKNVEFVDISLIDANTSATLKQTIKVTNGSYYIGFKYQKLIELANCKFKVNNEEIELTEMELTEVDKTINVTEHSITIELISDTNDACLVGDIIVVQGTKQSWSSNSNEIYTSTVKIGIGLEILSNTMKTKLLANADGVRIVNTNNNDVVAEFTDKGMSTNELTATSAKIAGLLIREVDGQTWITKL